MCDPLSASVLLCGLRLAGDDIVAAACGDLATYRVPLRLTLHQRECADSDNAGLRTPHERVLVCENPSVVAAASARLDARERARPRQVAQDVGGVGYTDRYDW